MGTSSKVADSSGFTWEAPATQAPGTAPNEDLKQVAFVAGAIHKTAAAAKDHRDSDELTLDQLTQLGVEPVLAQSIVAILTRPKAELEKTLLNSFCRQVGMTSGNDVELTEGLREGDFFAEVGKKLAVNTMLRFDPALVAVIGEGLAKGKAPESIMWRYDKFIGSIFSDPSLADYAEPLAELIVRAWQGTDHLAEHKIMLGCFGALLAPYADKEASLLNCIYLLIGKLTSCGSFVTTTVSELAPKDSCTDRQEQALADLIRSLVRNELLYEAVSEPIEERGRSSKELRQILHNYKDKALLDELSQFIKKKPTLSDSDFLALLERLPVGVGWGMAKPEKGKDERWLKRTYQRMSEFNLNDWDGKDFESIDLHILLNALDSVRVVHDRIKFIASRDLALNLIKKTYDYKRYVEGYKVDLERFVIKLYDKALNGDTQQEVKTEAAQV